jgi:GDP-D-mannose dehydratase
MKKALTTGITGEDGMYLAEFHFAKSWQETAASSPQNAEHEAHCHGFND